MGRQEISKINEQNSKNGSWSLWVAIVLQTWLLNTAKQQISSAAKTEVLEKWISKKLNILQLVQGIHEYLNEKGIQPKINWVHHKGEMQVHTHHGVYNENKPSKIRVVFDCSTKYQGRSLNSELMSGLDLTNQISGVLIRFRKEPIAITADIESIFYQNIKTS